MISASPAELVSVVVVLGKVIVVVEVVSKASVKVVSAVVVLGKVIVVVKVVSVTPFEVVSVVVVAVVGAGCGEAPPGEAR